MESASLCVSKWVKALSGTGLDDEVLWDPPPPPPDEELAAALVFVGRVVPFSDVVALEEVPVLALALDRTVEFELAAEDGDSAEVWLIFNEELVVPDDSADVDDAGAESAALEDAVSSAFPELAAAPEPAPDDDPAVFDAMAVGAVPTEVA